MEQEIKTQETEAQAPEVKSSEPVSPPTSEDTPEQINWKKFREAREKERKEKVEAEKRANEKEAEVSALKAAMEALVNKPESNNRQINEYSEETEEERIARLVSQSLEKERRKHQEENLKREQTEFPQRLANDFKDFHQVCNSENLDYLEYHYPEVAEAYKEMPDGYSKWSKIYKAVKRFVPNPDSRKEQAKAEKNFMKPQAMSVSGKTQVGDTAPQSLDDKRKTDNWSRMQKVIRGGGA
jgi:hypothetical protein